MRTHGTIIRGIRSPIIRKNDDLVKICVDSLLSAVKSEGFSIENRDIFGVTEAVLAISQGNYATTNDITQDISLKYKDDTIGLVFPILSRNRFFMILKGIAQTKKEIIIQLSYPSDEVGNPLIAKEKLNAFAINPWTDVFTASEFINKFGKCIHPYTNIDYLELYENVGNVKIIIANNPTEILKHTKNILVCDVHTRAMTKDLLNKTGATTLYSLDEILKCSVNGSGYNSQYGLLGSNIANDGEIKLFPRSSTEFVEKVQSVIYNRTGKMIEVLVYGDGGFKDPVCAIWELADPVISPGFTEGLQGMTNEIKLKYLADNEYAQLSGEELNYAIRKHLQKDDGNDFNKEGTTPRRIIDLVGSLCDLAAGSGSKGTPFVYIKGYFDHLGIE